MLNTHDLSYYLSLPYTIAVDQIGPGGRTGDYHAYCLEIPEVSIYYGATPEEAKEEARQILVTWIKARLQHQDILIPEP